MARWNSGGTNHVRVGKPMSFNACSLAYISIAVSHRVFHGYDYPWYDSQLQLTFAIALDFLDQPSVLCCQLNRCRIPAQEHVPASAWPYASNQAYRLDRFRPLYRLTHEFPNRHFLGTLMKAFALLGRSTDTSPRAAQCSRGRAGTRLFLSHSA